MTSKTKSTALTVKVEALPSTSPRRAAADIKSAFIKGDPARAAVFERVLLEAEARIAAHSYLTATAIK